MWVFVPSSHTHTHTHTHTAPQRLSQHPSIPGGELHPLNPAGKGQEEGGSGSEKVGHLLFHEAATALRVVSVGVFPLGQCPPLSQHSPVQPFFTEL